MATLLLKRVVVGVVVVWMVVSGDDCEGQDGDGGGDCQGQEGGEVMVMMAKVVVVIMMMVVRTEVLVIVRAQMMVRAEDYSS